MIRTLFAWMLVCSLLAGCSRTAGGPGTTARTAQFFGDTSPPAGQVFRYNNGAEPETTDPNVMSGQPDGRVARAIFEGLTVPDPQTLEPQPGQAYRWESAPDGRTWTFHLRPGLVWSDGTKLTAHDFVWSWRRVLKPTTASRSASLLYLLKNAERFAKDSTNSVPEDSIGVAAPDDSTLIVRLEAPTAYFLFLTQYYTYLPVPRRVIERYGARWTRPEHIVSNGPFVMDKWRPNDRFEFVKNPRYWDAASVRLDRIVAYSIDDLNTSTNLYKAGVTDWNPSGYIPSPFIPYLRDYADYRRGDYQGVYYYSINVTRKPYDNVWVRKALNLAVDRETISRDLLKGSRRAWGNFVPTGYPGYVHPAGMTYDPKQARECLARAGYPGGKGFPKVSILFNTSEDHRRIAEAIQAMWKRDLGIQVELSNQEWGSYLQATTGLQYDVARRSWIGDYLDPNTFLGAMMPGDGNNRTGWADREYESLLRAAAQETDPTRRMATLARAEARLLDQAPLIPIYHYSTNELIKPYVRGLYPTALDTHPFKYVSIDHSGGTKPAPTAGRSSPEARVAARGVR